MNPADQATPPIEIAIVPDVSGYEAAIQHILDLQHSMRAAEGAFLAAARIVALSLPTQRQGPAQRQGRSRAVRKSNPRRTKAGRRALKAQRKEQP